MNPLPLPTEDEHEPKARRASSARRTRGYITDFGAGRRCLVPGCETVLSRYHSGARCWVHDDDPPKR